MIRSTASSQFRVLDCSASIEVPDFPYDTDEADFSLSLIHWHHIISGNLFLFCQKNEI